MLFETAQRVEMQQVQALVFRLAQLVFSSVLLCLLEFIPVSLFMSYILVMVSGGRE